MTRRACCDGGVCLDLGAVTFHEDGSREDNPCPSRQPALWIGHEPPTCTRPYAHAERECVNGNARWIDPTRPRST